MNQPRNSSKWFVGAVAAVASVLLAVSAKAEITFSSGHAEVEGSGYISGNTVNGYLNAQIWHHNGTSTLSRNLSQALDGATNADWVFTGDRDTLVTDGDLGNNGLSTNLIRGVVYIFNNTTNPFTGDVTVSFKYLTPNANGVVGYGLYGYNLGGTAPTWNIAAARPADSVADLLAVNANRTVLGTGLLGTLTTGVETTFTSPPINIDQPYQRVALVVYITNFAGGQPDTAAVSSIELDSFAVTPAGPVDPCANLGGDTDADGDCNNADNCPDTANPGQEDNDVDGIGNACDACPNDAQNDVDGDGICGDVDVCPTDAANDVDGDGICGSVDACPNDANNDADGDGVCGDVDACPNDLDNDVDGDGICGDVDACPNDAQNDADGDGICGDVDACPNDIDNDADSDGICGNVDNCPAVSNADQLNYDSDTLGDACDNCDGVANQDQANDDGDSLGNACDNCPSDSNEGQANNDGDSQGDACDADDDNDGVADTSDNCQLVGNPSQADLDGDGAGDVCDGDVDGDGVDNTPDLCPNTAAGALVDANGCSGAQNVAAACPCVAVPAYKNHGAYVSCVARASEAQLNAGLLTQAQKDAIVSSAAKDNCGGKKK